MKLQRTNYDKGGASPPNRSRRHEVVQLKLRQPEFKPLALRRKSAANAIGVGVTKLDLLIATGEIAAVKSGKCLLIPVAELERYLASLPRAELNFAKRPGVVSR